MQTDGKYRRSGEEGNFINESKTPFSILNELATPKYESRGFFVFLELPFPDNNNKTKENVFQNLLLSGKGLRNATRAGSEEGRLFTQASNQTDFTREHSKKASLQDR